MHKKSKQVAREVERGEKTAKKIKIYLKKNPLDLDEIQLNYHAENNNAGIASNREGPTVPLCPTEIHNVQDSNVSSGALLIPPPTVETDYAQVSTNDISSENHMKNLFADK